MNVKVLAPDLERTLIDDALSARPRPGLLNFLAACHDRFARITIFTTVEESDAREVPEDLAADGYVPPALLNRLEFVDWCGVFKDLRFVPGLTERQGLLVVDDAGWTRPEQREQWIAITPWDGGPDRELLRVWSELEDRLAEFAA